jgi:hypothetical protein
MIRRHPVAFAVEVAAFAAFVAAFLFAARIPRVESGWAVLPHLLLNGAVLLLLAKFQREGRPPMYVSHFDLAVGVLFGYLVANVHYSEVRGVSWFAASSCLDGLAAFLMGRFLFFQRSRSYLVMLLGLCAFAVLLAIGTGYSQPLRLAGIEVTARACRVFLVFWLVSLPFLFLRKPSNLMFLVYVAILLVAGALWGLREAGALFGIGGGADAVEARLVDHANAAAAWHVGRTFPVTGCGVGALPVLFTAFRDSPTIPFAPRYSALLYAFAETGVVGALLLAYLAVRLPVYVMRRWKLFPNRRLRMLVVAFLAFFVTVVLMSAVSPVLFAPGVWLLAWSAIGVFVSLVMVRDPVRVFETGLIERRPVLPGRDRRPAGPSPLRAFAGNSGVVTAMAAVAVVTVGQVLPHYAERLSRSAPGELAGSPALGGRLERSVRLFPLLSEPWAKLAAHYQQKSGDPLQGLTQMPKVERSYLRAIELNPYVSKHYSGLRDAYGEMNEPVKALDTLIRGVRNNPNDLILRLLLVRELERNGRLALATYHVKQAVMRIDPRQVELYIRLAELYELRGMKDQAVRYYQYARQVVPDTPQSAGRMRRLAEKLGLAE